MPGKRWKGTKVVVGGGGGGGGGVGTQKSKLPVAMTFCGSMAVLIDLSAVCVDSDRMDGSHFLRILPTPG